ncbi:MAG TPA: Dyp-type peroxidase, partial [Chitinophagaceae bacterium]|nr:Dyp-type peroxidase [Chitinophagaceae bacterium]
HIRRTNPRDAFEDNKAKLSSKLTNKHRIIRRGRSYGEAIDAGPNNYKTKDEVGLHFICVNANIENQFEFIQRTWSNNPSFQNLYNEPDPLTGTQENIDKSLTQNFTVQDYPTNRCIQNLPQFVTIRGGAYFFLPSMSAIKYLATI